MKPFDIDLAIERVREAVRPFPRAMLFQLYDEGFTIAGARRFLQDTENGTAEPNAKGEEPLPSAESATAELNRKMLLDLRDSLRSFLTLLERK